jgi:hypothetical protein
MGQSDPPPASVDYVVGLDLAPPQLHSAAAVLERTTPRPTAEAPVPQSSYVVCYLHRWPLQTMYSAIAADVAALVKKPPLKMPRLAIDMTACGQAVINSLRTGEFAAMVQTIQVTGGYAEAAGQGAAVCVPKRELVGVLQVLLQSRRLAINGSIEHAATLKKELTEFRAAVTLSDDARPEWRGRPDEDLALAVALAAWLGEPGAYAGPLSVYVEPVRDARATLRPHHGGAQYRRRLFGARR